MLLLEKVLEKDVFMIKDVAEIYNIPYATAKQRVLKAQRLGIVQLYKVIVDTDGRQRRLYTSAQPGEKNTNILLLQPKDPKLRSTAKRQHLVERFSRIAEHEQLFTVKTVEQVLQVSRKYAESLLHDGKKFGVISALYREYCAIQGSGTVRYYFSDGLSNTHLGHDIAYKYDNSDKYYTVGTLRIMARLFIIISVRENRDFTAQDIETLQSDSVDNSNIANYITKACQRNIIYRVERGVYRLTPEAQMVLQELSLSIQLPKKYDYTFVLRRLLRQTIQKVVAQYPKFTVYDLQRVLRLNIIEAFNLLHEAEKYGVLVKVETIDHTSFQQSKRLYFYAFPSKKHTPIQSNDSECTPHEEYFMPRMQAIASVKTPFTTKDIQEHFGIHYRRASSWVRQAKAIGIIHTIEGSRHGCELHELCTTTTTTALSAEQIPKTVKNIQVYDILPVFTAIAERKPIFTLKDVEAYLSEIGYSGSQQRYAYQIHRAVVAGIVQHVGTKRTRKYYALASSNITFMPYRKIQLNTPEIMWQLFEEYRFVTFSLLAKHSHTSYSYSRTILLQEVERGNVQQLSVKRGNQVLFALATDTTAPQDVELFIRQRTRKAKEEQYTEIIRAIAEEHRFLLIDVLTKKLQRRIETVRCIVNKEVQRGFLQLLPVRKNGHKLYALATDTTAPQDAQAMFGKHTITDTNIKHTIYDKYDKKQRKELFDNLLQQHRFITSDMVAKHMKKTPSNSLMLLNNEVKRGFLQRLSVKGTRTVYFALATDTTAPQDIQTIDFDTLKKNNK